MKEPEYIEGPKATENFERGIKALFKFPRPPFYSERSSRPLAFETTKGEPPRGGGEVVADVSLSATRLSRLGSFDEAVRLAPSSGILPA